MQALWMSWKENAYCGYKLPDMVIWPDRLQQRKTGGHAKDTLDKKFIRHMRNSFREAIMGQYNTRTLLCELNIGDPARNIIEIIFQRASANPLNQSRKIKRVLRVKNSVEILQRFERYREEVKGSTYEQHKRHPRSSVDGNELLRFYGTTISCSRKKSTRVSELCRDPTCCVCRILQSNFDTEYTKMNGIRLSSNSEEMSDDSNSSQKMQKVARAAIVCRTIAGMNVHRLEVANEGEDPMAPERRAYKDQSLTIRNPSAVLPCFIIVFC